MSFDESFLPDLEPRHWSTVEGGPRLLTPLVLFFGRGDHGLEVGLAASRSRPSADDVRKLWHARQGRRPAPLLLIVGYPEGEETRATVCGPAGHQPPLVAGLKISQVERVAAAALAEPSRHAAIRLLMAMLPEVGSDLPGLRNSGLLATQELRTGVPARHDWRHACEESRPFLSLRGRKLVEGLGFGIEQLSVSSSVLTLPGGSKRAVAVFLDEGEAFDDAADRFGTSPVSHGLALADRESLPWVLLTRAREIRLYAARPDTGVGRKGRAETFVELNLALLPDDRAGYLKLLFSSSALAENGTIEQVLDRSADFAAELAVRLRERVYFEAVPVLARAVAARLDRTGHLSDADLSAAYEQTLTILFRLLFLAYAEDKDLLPYRTNSRYADHALKTIARRLTEDRAKSRVHFDKQATDLWGDVRQLWWAVNKGNLGWGVPPYNGGLFSIEEDVNPAGAVISRMELADAEFGPALMALLVDEGPDGVGPVDFRSLSVREFGTIYEGLLESRLSVAPTDLTVDAKNHYVPSKPSENVTVAAGEIYFHNSSGARKATGSYFTKPFAVAHLLDHALEAALTDHVARLQAHLDCGDEAAVRDAFFDFRCVDLAMGSGHFLVAAVDRIEARLSGFLALNPIPAVQAELTSLRSAALLALGDLSDGVEIETASLLRRQVARRCIYGVDLNRISVELARLAVWIHTFVPGLPLSFLDHSLVCGNSLTGVGSLDEALSILDPTAEETGIDSLYRAEIEGFLARAGEALRRLARVSEVTVADIEVARAAHAAALTAVEPARKLFDILVAARLGEVNLPVTADEQVIARAPGLPKAEELVGALRALHFPVAFPEVFLRDRPGFDCILGNPPWEKLHVEEHAFWGLRFPGLRSMPVAQLNREMVRLKRERPDLVEEYKAEVAGADLMRATLLKGPYPDLGASHPDLYKAFCWRFWQLVRTGGLVGVVLPRSALSSAGSASWRIEVLNGGTFTDVTTVTNTGGWVFDDAEHRYTIAFVAIRSDTVDRTIHMHGPFATLASYQQHTDGEALIVKTDQLLAWSPGGSFPLIPSPRAGQVFLKFRTHQRLDVDGGGFQITRLQGDLNSTTGKILMRFDVGRTQGVWPVYKGASFNLWEPDTGDYYAWINESIAIAELQEKRMSSYRRAGSAFEGFDIRWIKNIGTLPCRHPRIAFRRIARATDTRTSIAALIPPEVVLTDVAPYILFPKGGPVDEAYLLGMLCSIPFDWLARRTVEAHMDFHVFDSLTVPRPPLSSPLRLRVSQIAGRLAAVDERYANWAEAVGVPVASVTEADKPSLLAELDAAAAHLYGLSSQDVKVVFGTFHVGWDYAARLSAVLDHYKDMA